MGLAELPDPFCITETSSQALQMLHCAAAGGISHTVFLLVLDKKDEVT